MTGRNPNPEMLLAYLDVCAGKSVKEAASYRDVNFLSLKSYVTRRGGVVMCRINYHIEQIQLEGGMERKGRETRKAIKPDRSVGVAFNSPHQFTMGFM